MTTVLEESGRPDDRFSQRPGYCRECLELPNKRLVRIVIRERWTVLVLYLTIKDGILGREAEYFCKFRENIFEQSHPSIIGMATGGSSVTVDLGNMEMIAPLLNTLAVCLNIDPCLVNRSVENILISANDILVDFNLEKLIAMSKRNMRTIGSVFVRGGWFSMASKYTVIPMHTETVDRNQFESYFKCVHMVQRSFKHAVSCHFGRYFYDDDMYPRINTYPLFKLKKHRAHNPDVLLEVNDTKNIGINTARVLRYSPDANVNDIDIVRLLENRFMDRIHGEPFNMHSFETETNTYVFYMVCVELTPEYFYNLLVLLRELLERMSITSIEILNISETRHLKFSRVFKMINHVFMDSGILVIVPRIRNSNLCCGL